MSLRLEWEWEPAPGVRLPELAATWSTLQIDVGDVTATLVEERESRSGLRRRINVPTYPLAEWIAYNWWALASPTPSGRDGVTLAGAGDGFPWPDLALSSGPGYMLATLRRTNRSRSPVRFLAEAEVLLEPEAARFELQRFVEDTIQQLDDAKVSGTPLHEEWAAITSADDDVRAFCRTAAALTLDPYDLSDDETGLVLAIGKGSDDADLLAELAATLAVTANRGTVATEAGAWLGSALSRIEASTHPPELDLPFSPLPKGRWARPWSVGYQRAREVRESLGVAPGDPLDVDALVRVAEVQNRTPQGVAALAKAYGAGTVVAVSSTASDQTRRFAAARAIGRRTFDDSEGGLLLTSRDEYAAKVERAFAAEVLAPADGLRDKLTGDPTEQIVEATARDYGVSVRVIEHQMENQLGSWLGF